jgi:hypothetical protein
MAYRASPESGSFVAGQRLRVTASGPPPELGVPAVPWGTGAPTLPRPGLGRQMGGSGAWFALEPVGRPRGRLRRVRTHVYAVLLTATRRPDTRTPARLGTPPEPAEGDAVDAAGDQPSGKARLVVACLTRSRHVPERAEDWAQDAIRLKDSRPDGDLRHLKGPGSLVRRSSTGRGEFGRVVAERARSVCALASTLVPTSCCSYPDTDGYEQPKGGSSPRGFEPVPEDWRHWRLSRT